MENTMNEQISDLAEQLWFHLYDMGYELIDDDGNINWEFLHHYDHALARRVAEECANICDNFQARNVGMQPSECAGAIRHRFGVET
jgi:hypothetical protein